MIVAPRPGEVWWRSPQGMWRHFCNPCAVVVAYQVSEVVLALEQVERYCLAGLHAMGGVRYEAAPAFDAHLQVVPSHTELLWFGIYSQFQEYPRELFIESPEMQEPVWVALQESASYARAFECIQQHIQAGDCYQVNYTFPLKGISQTYPWGVFLKRFAPLPSGYLLYMNMGSCVVASSSPELFFEKKSHQLRCRPMKGTRPRGATPEQDAFWRTDLAEHFKDRAENLMIVDMMRNDLGRISEVGSVQVDSLLEIEAYPTVWQMVSQISSRSSASLSEIFKALFPCASVTGAPKDAAMGIIAHLENRERGYYTGALGYVQPGGDALFSVAIRTLQQESGQRISYSVGSGLVADSDWNSEYEECFHKAKVLGAIPSAFELLETLLQTPEGDYWLLEGHLQRLERSAHYFGFPWTPQEVFNALNECPSSGEYARIRLLYSCSGNVSVQRLVLPNDPRDSSQKWNITVVSEPLQTHPSWLCHKTTQRTHYDQVLASNDGFDDVVLYNNQGYITESCKANVVIETDKGWWTPPQQLALLPGVFREQLILTGRVQEQAFTVDDLLAARSVWLVNSLRGWIPCEIKKA